MSKIVNAIIGHVIGDTLGGPYELFTRDKMKIYPAKDIMRTSKYSDDSAMTLATMRSITDNNGIIDYEDIMYEFYLWLAYGKHTPDNTPYGYSGTVFDSVNKFSLGYDPLKCGNPSEYCNGNGALMRIIPFILYLYKTGADDSKIYETIKNATLLTHAHKHNLMGTYIFTRFCLFLLNGYSKEESYKMVRELDYKILFDKSTIEKYNRIIKRNLIDCKEDDILSGMAVWETLEAVLWSILHSNSFKTAILTAVNLGGDTDTVGAITGDVAGIIYDEIPKDWTKKIKGFKTIKKDAEKFEKVLDDLVE